MNAQQARELSQQAAEQTERRLLEKIAGNAKCGLRYAYSDVPLSADTIKNLLDLGYTVEAVMTEFKISW